MELMASRAQRGSYFFQGFNNNPSTRRTECLAESDLAFQVLLFLPGIYPGINHRIGVTWLPRASCWLSDSDRTTWKPLHFGPRG